MSKNAEEKVKELLESDMVKNMDMAKLSAVMNSPAGKALQRQLGAPSGKALRKAAAEAAEGDTAAVSQMLSELMSTKEGEALAEQVKEMKKGM